MKWENLLQPRPHAQPVRGQQRPDPRQLQLGHRRRGQPGQRPGRLPQGRTRPPGTRATRPPDPAHPDLRKPACRSTCSGPQNSQAAIDYVAFEESRKHTITQQGGQRQRHLRHRPLLEPAERNRWPSRPGAEWRREESRNINDELVKSGITESARSLTPAAGSRFARCSASSAPILQDAPCAYRLSLNGAIPYTDY